MCRMFAVNGSPEFASSLQKALISAAESDDFRNNKGNHDSGWGGVWYSDSCQEYFRTTTPIFDDSNAPEFFEQGDNRLTGLSHARLAAQGEPLRGPFDSHPFFVQIGDELVYLTHNGQVDKYKLKDEAGVKDVSKLNDSEVFTFLLGNIEGSSLKERLDGAIRIVHQKDAMKGALNLMLLSIIRGGEKRIYYYCDFPDKSKELYYSLYAMKDDENSAVMSSTVAYRAGFISKDGEPANPKVSKCPIGKVLAL
ncbi:MAG: class II glutamine amidotransferase [Thaumarchaeota archaeon]|nr:class II glutamine amidotransferase [Nitrososphaerota archaeon]